MNMIAKVEDEHHEAGVQFLNEFAKRWPGVREAIGNTLATQLERNSTIDLLDEQQEITLFVERMVAKATARLGQSTGQNDVAQAATLMIVGTCVQSVIMHTLASMISQADDYMPGESDKLKRKACLVMTADFLCNHRDATTKFIGVHYNHLMANTIDTVLPRKDK